MKSIMRLHVLGYSKEPVKRRQKTFLKFFVFQNKNRNNPTYIIEITKEKVLCFSLCFCVVVFFLSLNLRMKIRKKCTKYSRHIFVLITVNIISPIDFSGSRNTFIKIKLYLQNCFLFQTSIFIKA